MYEEVPGIVWQMIQLTIHSRIVKINHRYPFLLNLRSALRSARIYIERTAMEHSTADQKCCCLHPFSAKMYVNMVVIRLFREDEEQRNQQNARKSQKLPLLWLCSWIFSEKKWRKWIYHFSWQNNRVSETQIINEWIFVSMVSKKWQPQTRGSRFWQLLVRCSLERAFRKKEEKYEMKKRKFWINGREQTTLLNFYFCVERRFLTFKF